MDVKARAKVNQYLHWHHNTLHVIRSTLKQ